jgi:hypothetical protein
LNIISFDNARVTWLFPLEEFAPAAGLDIAMLFMAIAQRYNFAKPPSHIFTRDEYAKNGIHFAVGQFAAEGAKVNIGEFVIYTDGIVAISEKTHGADAFLSDLYDWLRDEMGFRVPVSGIKRLYASTVIVDFEKPVSGLLGKFDEIAKLITSRAITIMPEVKPFQFSRLDLEIDKATLQGQIALPKFVLERRANAGFELERFFSTAPMKTPDHIEVLEELEVMASTA